MKEEMGVGRLARREGSEGSLLGVSTSGNSPAEDRYPLFGSSLRDD